MKSHGLVTKTQPRSKEAEKKKKAIYNEIKESLKKAIKKFSPQSNSCIFYIECRTDKNCKIYYMSLGLSKWIDDNPG